MTGPNPFVALAKWASSQTENFTTECLVTTLETLRQQEGRTFEAFVNSTFEFSASASQTEILTQVHRASGIPDVVLRTPESELVIEVKVDSDLGDLQLERYRADMAPNARLALLSKVPLSGDAADLRVLWHDVGTGLQGTGKNPMKEPASSMVSWMVGLLEEGEFMRRPVTYSFGPGLVEYRRLMMLLRQCLVDHGVEMRGKRLNSAPNWTGFLLGDGQVAVGVEYPSVFQLTFEILKRARTLAPLDLLSVKFFDRSPKQQMRIIHEWLHENLKESGFPAKVSCSIALDQPIGYQFGQASRDFRRFFEYLREAMSSLGYGFKGKRIQVWDDGMSWNLTGFGAGIDFADPWNLSFGGKRGNTWKEDYRVDMRAAGFFDADLPGQLQLLRQWVLEAQAAGFRKPTTGAPS